MIYLRFYAWSCAVHNDRNVVATTTERSDPRFVGPIMALIVWRITTAFN